MELGAQNVHWERSGAFTGEVSAAMLRALQVKYVVIGHSERRQWFGETDELVGKKVTTALHAGLHPLFCVGESLSERDENRVEEVLERQLRKGLGDCSPQDLSSVVIAYEPVWAIGTGRTATAAQAQEASEAKHSTNVFQTFFRDHCLTANHTNPMVRQAYMHFYSR
jgi:triosephosphate isomerase